MLRNLLALTAAVSLAQAGMAPGALRADQRDTRLGPLFARLQTTTSASEAESIESRIWRIWGESDNAAVAPLMREGVVAMAEGRYPVALDRFDRLVEQVPDFAEGWNKRATVYYLMGNYPASVLDIRRTLELEPRHFGALSGLGLIYDALDDPAAALRSFEAAVAIDPHLETAQERIKELRRQVGGRPT
jgi:tetratricopeptide (TPR) repeat protein